VVEVADLTLGISVRLYRYADEPVVIPVNLTVETEHWKGAWAGRSGGAAAAEGSAPWGAACQCHPLFFSPAGAGETGEAAGRTQRGQPPAHTSSGVPPPPQPSPAAAGEAMAPWGAV